MHAKQAVAGRPRGRFPVAREGSPFIVFSGAAVAVAWVLEWWWITAALAVLFALIVNFFRDPERRAPDDPRALLAPADGRVIRCETIEGVWHIDIFMNIFNVHVNRSPISGRITHMQYFPGAFVNASFDKASEHNERNSFTLVSDNGASVTCTQIAGLVARRIVSYVAVGDYVRAGQRVGMIRFGSRVDCRIPDGFEVCVVVGDKVKAGESILARAQADV